MKYLLINKISIFIIVFLLGCHSPKKSIDNYKEIIKIFNQEETNDLKKILSFFDSAVCKSENLNKNDLNNCYNQYFKRMKVEEKRTGNFEIQISYQEQKKLINHLNVNTFNQIWTKYKTNYDKLDTLEILSFNLNGKFVAFLKEFGETNNKIHSYQERLEAVGDISPTMMGDIVVNYTDYNISDDRIRLFIAIHYLTLNQQFEARKAFNLLQN